MRRLAVQLSFHFAWHSSNRCCTQNCGFWQLRRMSPTRWAPRRLAGGGGVSGITGHKQEPLVLPPLVLSPLRLRLEHPACLFTRPVGSPFRHLSLSPLSPAPPPQCSWWASVWPCSRSAGAEGGWGPILVLGLPTPCVTFRRVSVFVTGPRTVTRSSRVASGQCFLMAAAAGVPAGVVSAFAVPSSWRTGGCAGRCGGRFTVFAAHFPPRSDHPPHASPRFCVREAKPLRALSWSAPFPPSAKANIPCAMRAQARHRPTHADTGRSCCPCQRPPPALPPAQLRPFPSVHFPRPITPAHTNDRRGPSNVRPAPGGAVLRQQLEAQHLVLRQEHVRLERAEMRFAEGPIRLGQRRVASAGVHLRSTYDNKKTCP